jgi:hypothetical protein
VRQRQREREESKKVFAIFARSQIVATVIMMKIFTLYFCFKGEMYRKKKYVK